MISPKPINLSACFQAGPQVSILNLHLSSNSENELKKKAQAQLRQCTDSIERLRYICLSNKISTLKDLFRVIKTTNSCNGAIKRVSQEEFIHAFEQIDLKIELSDLILAFQALDVQNCGSVSLNDLEKIEPSLNNNRRGLLEKIFGAIDKDAKGYCTIDKLESHYNYKKNPLYTTGVKTKTEIFATFLELFNIGIHEDNRVTKEDFLHYYTAVSAAIENDVYFDLTMRNYWNV